jgi:hypothetical protein
MPRLKAIRMIVRFSWLWKSSDSSPLRSKFWGFIRLTLPVSPETAEGLQAAGQLYDRVANATASHYHSQLFLLKKFLNSGRDSPI